MLQNNKLVWASLEDKKLRDFKITQYFYIWYITDMLIWFVNHKCNSCYMWQKYIYTSEALPYSSLSQQKWSWLQSIMVRQVCDG